MSAAGNTAPIWTLKVHMKSMKLSNSQSVILIQSHAKLQNTKDMLILL